MPKDTTTSGKASAGAPVPAASAVNAKASFKNFSLSRITKLKPARTYVTKSENVAEKRKSLMKDQLTKMSAGGPGMTLIISDQKALNMKDGKIDLTTLIDAMEKTRQGRQFYTSGTSVAEQIGNQNQVEDFFKALKGKKNAQPK